MAFAPVGYGPNLNFPANNRGVGFADQNNGNTNNVNGIGNTVTNNNTNNKSHKITSDLTLLRTAPAPPGGPLARLRSDDEDTVVRRISKLGLRQNKRRAHRRRRR